MTLLLRSKEFLKHQTGKHPERPDRLLALDAMLGKTDLGKKCQTAEWLEIPEKDLAELHSPKQVEQIKQLSAHGGGRADPDTVVCPDSYVVAKIAAGACIAAVDLVLQGKHANALCLVRPPGHHATAGVSMGFCLFNNVALAARRAIKQHRLNRVAILDWDVHHGNGTQDIFYSDPAVFFLSLHRFGDGFYPGTGAASETGQGKGLGATLNLPIRYGTAPKDIRSQWEKGLDMVRQFRPELLLISAGFDADRRDPIGDLGLGPEDFFHFSKTAIALAKDQCQGKIITCLEGGYHLDALAEGMQKHLENLVRE
ncbi:MAG: histone deacetylase [Gemmataceae bacterium]|nr:histone deacetylase [Gemmataceae bacterium]